MSNNLSKNLVFLHPFPLNHKFWNAQIEFFRVSHNVLAPDLLGFGKNATQGYAYTIDHQCHSLYQLLSENNQKYVLIGCSLGGYVALRFAELYPDWVEAVVLCNSHPFADTNVAKQNRANTINKLRNIGVQNFAKEFIPNALSRNSIDNSSEIIQQLSSLVEESTVEDISAAILCLAARTDTSDFVKTTQIPVFLISGDQDNFINEEIRNKTIELNPDIISVVIENTGHFSAVEKSEIFNQELNNLINTLE
jgi:pimeloyl-ACP methyl ester carboxylesterase